MTAAERLFFDRPALEKYIKKEEIKPLSRVGAIIRRTARSSIKVVAPTKGMLARLRDPDPKKRARAIKTLAERRAKSSPAGRPPFSHAGRSDSLSIRNIQFAYDIQSRTLVVGPVKVGGAQSNDVPYKLEHGGFVDHYEIEQSVDVSVGRRRGARGRFETITKKVSAWRPVSKSTYSRWNGRKRISKKPMAARPTMGLALAANEAKIPQQFRSRV